MTTVAKKQCGNMWFYLEARGVRSYIAVASAAWWSVEGPLLMSWLLMRVSGVTLLEKDIKERPPRYADYVRRTNAFFPGLPKS
ncbi:MAG: DUF1295 domain-containing protein [Steroidobacteraceae bacterium]